MSSDQQSSSSLIWFLLLDSATGEPYKRTTADKVSVSSSADVADFRDAVKVKHSNKLSSVDASQLLVYKNKASFDKRNSQNGKEEPLEVDSLVDGLGETEEEALIVAVQVSDASNLSYTSMPDKLRQLGVEFTMKDLNYIVDNDRDRLLILMSPTLTTDVAQALLNFAKSKIKSSTKRAIALEHSFFLNGSVM